MIGLDNTFHERQAQSPTTLLSRITRIEDCLEFGLGNSFAGIRYVNADLFVGFLHLEGDGALSFHGIDSILQQILDDPSKEGITHQYQDGMVNQRGMNFHLG